MGFISFNEAYYRRKLDIFENKILTQADIYELRQLLKVLDDLADEGYTNLNTRMEDDFMCLSRLRALLEKNGALPFSTGRNRLSTSPFTSEEYELSAVLEKLTEESKKAGSSTGNPFLNDILGYSHWIGYEDNTAYIFLLRDTLLPYIYFKARHYKNIYPWLVSRKFLEDVTGVEYIDDDIRLPIYEALENGCKNFDDCFSFCKKAMCDVLDSYPKLKRVLLELLGSVKEKRIVVVESGYMGTIPMMLKALDNRVTFRLYTTAPFLYDTYRDNIFCTRYEDVRKFETLYSQDLLTGYSSFNDNKFYVNLSADEEVRKRSLEEIYGFTL